MEFLGAVSLHDIKEFLDQPELGNMVIAADIMKETSRGSRRSNAWRRSGKIFGSGRERLPVVDNLSSQRLIGSISKTDIMLHLAGKVRSKTAG